MDDETRLKVGEVARLAHVSVRTLHHYDRLGLLRPSARSDAGYRLYAGPDLERLQQILLYRESGIPLEEIAGLMDAAVFDRAEVLERQRAQLAARREQLGAMIRLVDATLATLRGERQMTHEEMFEAFGDFDPAAHEDEARERWGDTPAYAEAQRRTRSYTKDDWLRYRRESDEVNERLAALLGAGEPPEDRRAQEAVEQHRLLIDRWFYPCSQEMHAALGEMYVADPRFTATFDKVRPGLAQYLRDGAAAALGRHGG
jgi:MerR family transcriptional regulator, thiopeptide resistance regulator